MRVALKFFENAIETKMIPMPNDHYRELQQAFISDQWDNTTSRYTIQEQKMVNNEFPTFEFDETEAWINYVVGQTSNGLKNGDDFRQLSFECIDHPCVRGRYYYFDDNYWIAYFTDEYDSVAKTLAVRRCNNFLRIVDPENGAIFSAPCVIDYDMASPMNQISKYIITPNSHATVMVQGNPDTLRLFKINTRYILGGRPFKLYAYQNAINDDSVTPTPTLLYLDLYLDEEHAEDDIVNQVAYNGTYDYKIVFNYQGAYIAMGSSGKFSATVLLNGEEVNKEVVWSLGYEADKANINLNSDGSYEVIGTVASRLIRVRVSLVSNPNVYIQRTFRTIGASVPTGKIPKVILNPTITSIREYESVETEVEAFYLGNTYPVFRTQMSLSQTENIMENEYISIVQIGDGVTANSAYRLTCKKRSPTPVRVWVHYEHDGPEFSSTQSIDINLVSMMG